MAYDEELAARVRKALAHIDDVEEKIMFRGLTFMVDGKMCISVNAHGLMCRIDPAIHETEVQKDGCSTMQMKGRSYIGYINVDTECVRLKADLDHWVRLSLEYNKVAKAAKRKKG